MLVDWTLPVNIDRMLADLVTGSPVRPEVRVPRADLIETPNGYRVVLEMPGVSAEGLKIEVEKDDLMVRGERPARDETAQVLIQGRHVGTPFERHFTIGDDIDRDKIQARIENGMLTLELPRSEALRPRRIEVESQL